MTCVKQEVSATCIDQMLSQPLAQPLAIIKPSGLKAKAEMGAMWPHSVTSAFFLACPLCCWLSLTWTSAALSCEQWKHQYTLQDK